MRKKKKKKGGIKFLILKSKKIPTLHDKKFPKITGLFEEERDYMIGEGWGSGSTNNTENPPSTATDGPSLNLWIWLRLFISV